MDRDDECTFTVVPIILPRVHWCCNALFRYTSSMRLSQLRPPAAPLVVPRAATMPSRMPRAMPSRMPPVARPLATVGTPLTSPLSLLFALAPTTAAPSPVGEGLLFRARAEREDGELSDHWIDCRLVRIPPENLVEIKLHDEVPGIRPAPLVPQSMVLSVNQGPDMEG